MNRWTALILFLTVCPASADSPWAPVEKTLGRQGIEQGNRITLVFPRADLNVVVNGIPLEPEGALSSWFAFTSMAKSTQLAGHLVLLDQEVPKVTAQVLQNGLEITALYSPFLDESPGLRCLNFGGMGTKSSLAWAAKLLLSATGTPVGVLSPAVPAGTPSPFDKAPEWSKVQAVLGTGQVKGRTLLFQFPLGEPGDVDPAPGNAATLIFQQSGDQTAAMGEFVLTGGEINPVLGALASHHITLTSLHRQGSPEGPGLFYLDFWVLGKGTEVAGNLKAILDQAGLTDTK